jgi:uncharacterized protein (TIGR02118 family)
MIKVNIFYPYAEGASFDVDYYSTKHMPMVAELTAGACRGWSVDSGIGGGAPGTPPTYVCVGSALYDSVEAFGAAFGPHAEQIMGDIPNYTDIAPIIQLSEVVVG